MENSEIVYNQYGHACTKQYEDTSLGIVCKLVELRRQIAEKQPWYNPKKQILFKDGNGRNLDPGNLTHDWTEVNMSGREKPVVATVAGKVMQFSSIAECAEYLNLDPLAISQALYRGTNIGGYFIEYYFGTLDGGVKVDLKGIKGPVSGQKKEGRVSVDGRVFKRVKDAAAFLGSNPTTLSIYFKRGKKTLKGHSIKKL